MFNIGRERHICARPPTSAASLLPHTNNPTRSQLCQPAAHSSRISHSSTTNTNFDTFTSISECSKEATDKDSGGDAVPSGKSFKRNTEQNGH